MLKYGFNFILQIEGGGGQDSEAFIKHTHTKLQWRTNNHKNSRFNPKSKTNYPYKITISDDASTDNSIKVIEKYRKKHKDKIKLIKQKKNLKVCKNTIALYKQMDSEYFCTLDSDDY